MKLLRKCLTGIAALSLVASPAVAHGWHGGGRYGEYRHGHFSDGLVLGLGVGVLGGYTYGHNNYYPNNAYYGYIPSCPQGMYLAHDPYTINGYVCAWQ